MAIPFRNCQNNIQDELYQKQKRNIEKWTTALSLLSSQFLAPKNPPSFWARGTGKLLVVFRQVCLQQVCLLQVYFTVKLRLSDSIWPPS
ncbi:MAG: hypothetical protein OEZ28_13570, partial [Nitrospinota bacterium]|nr:hypothetical protein [Nitrospinota bacterium]